MKRSGVCPKCAGERIGRFEQKGKPVVTPGGWGPLPAGWTPPAPAQLSELDVERYVCAGCGYSEWYVRDAANVDWDRVGGWAWHRPKERAGPFR